VKRPVGRGNQASLVYSSRPYLPGFLGRILIQPWQPVAHRSNIYNLAHGTEGASANTGCSICKPQLKRTSRYGSSVLCRLFRLGASIIGTIRSDFHVSCPLGYAAVIDEASVIAMVD